MAKISEIGVKRGPVYRRQTFDEDIWVSIHESRIDIRLDKMCSAQRGGPQEVTKSITLDLTETFSQLFERAKKALNEAFEEMGEYLMAWTEVKCDIGATLKALDGIERSAEHIEAIKTLQQERRANTPCGRLETALKSALLEANVTLAE